MRANLACGQFCKEEIEAVNPTTCQTLLLFSFRWKLRTASQVLENLRFSWIGAGIDLTLPDRFLLVSSLVRNIVPEKSRKSIMLRQTESPFEVLLNRHSYSSAQSASHLNTQADSLLSVLYKNPLKEKYPQQRISFEFHG